MPRTDDSELLGAMGGASTSKVLGSMVAAFVVLGLASFSYFAVQDGGRDETPTRVVLDLNEVRAGDLYDPVARRSSCIDTGDRDEQPDCSSPGVALPPGRRLTP